VWLIITGLVALAAAAGAVVGGSARVSDLGTAAGPTGSVGGLSPEQTAIAYFEALDGRDCAAIIDLVSEGSWQAGGQFASPEEAAEGCNAGALFAGNPTFSIDHIELVSQDGVVAVLSITGSADGQAETLQLKLVSDEGVWKIDLTDGGESSGGTGTEVTAPPAQPGTTVADPAPPPPGNPSTTVPSPPTGDPEEAAATVQAFYDAMIAENCPSLVGMTTPFFWASLVTDSNPNDLEAVCAEAFANGYLTTDMAVQGITLEHHEGTTATFSTSLSLGQQGTPYTEFVDAVLEAGAWKVNQLY
jgi:hypothetical protein